LPGDDDKRNEIRRAVDKAFAEERARRSPRQTLIWIVGALAVVFVLAQTGFFGQSRDVTALVDVDTAEVDRLLQESPILPVIGNASRDGVRMIAFFDYACSHCRHMAPVVDEAVALTEDLHVVLLEYPVLGPESVLAARYALAAKLQGSYGPYHRALMFSIVPYTDEGLTDLGANLGLDPDRLREDAHGDPVAETLAHNRVIGSALQVDGTPTFVVGDLLFVGTIDESTLFGLISSQRAP